MISQEEALLWTDGRYFLQAEKELEEGWSMRKMLEGERKWFEHISDRYPPKTRIEIDARLIAAGSARDRKSYFEEKDFELSFSSNSLVDEIWENRPPSGAT